MMPGVRVPILAYHAVEAGPGPLCIDPTGFAAVVEELDAAGYRSMTAGELAVYVSREEPPPPQTVVFTFDDGYASVHGHALPILRSHGFTATVFPVTAHLGGTNRWDEGRAGTPTLRLMDRRQLETLVAAGWEIGGHTHTHRVMPRLTDTEIVDELARSNEILADIAGETVQSFAYPFGLHDSRVRKFTGGTYRLCLEIGAREFSPSDPLDRAPRVEGWYARSGRQARRLSGALGPLYLAGRRTARGARRAWPLGGGGAR
jgi:peptidoglycan/xylan/chitin deacetylase (PgdA/CDA1 family)